MPALMPAFAEVAEALQKSGLGVDAAELHGGLCGLLCGRGRQPRWLADVLADADVPAPAADSVLGRLEAATAERFASEDLDLELLMPDDDAPLTQRGDALVAWCRGFVGGLGLAGATARMGEESQEALADVARIAASELSYDDDETDEEALAEVVEFVRVVAMLIHNDCLPPRSAAETLH